MDVSFDSVDSVYESFDWTYGLTGLQYEPTNQECDFTDYEPYVSTASVCEQTEVFNSVDSVYKSMDWTHGLTGGLQCEPTNRECDLTDYDPYVSTASVCAQTETFDPVDSVYQSMDWPYGLTGLQYEPTNRESDLTDYNAYVSTASVCAQTETFDPVDSVYEPMDLPYGLTGLQCEPTSFSHTPTDLEHDWKDFHPYAPTEEPFEQTEGKAWRLLAARIPPELFDDILFYVNVDRISQRAEYRRDNGGNLARNQGKPSPNDTLTDLKRCSLVCLFWANRCREHMFSARTLEINSYEDAEIFRRYVVGGCQRLTPVHRLISGIQVYQSYHIRKSFLHLLYLPAIQDKLEEFFINGPVPNGFNHTQLNTPHWSIPPFIVVPSSFLQSNIHLQNIHLPSFYHVTKYIRSFTGATSIKFDRISWDGQTPTYSLPQASDKVACQRRPRSLWIRAEGVCTDSVHLALTALMLNRNCPLHRLSDEERAWMIKFMTLLWGDKKDPYVSIDFDVSEKTTTMNLRTFHFVFEETSASTGRSASALSVVRMHAYIYNSDDLLANFDALIGHARTHSIIRACVLLFASIDRLKESVKHFVGVLTPVNETIEILLAYREKAGRAVGVDPVTLEPNGRIWADLPAVWGVDNKFEILRQERTWKKRR